MAGGIGEGSRISILRGGRRSAPGTRAGKRYRLAEGAYGGGSGGTWQAWPLRLAQRALTCTHRLSRLFVALPVWALLLLGTSGEHIKTITCLTMPVYTSALTSNCLQCGRTCAAKPYGTFLYKSCAAAKRANAKAGMAGERHALTPCASPRVARCDARSHLSRILPIARRTNSDIAS